MEIAHVIGIGRCLGGRGWEAASSINRHLLHGFECKEELLRALQVP
jgi:hypothetical protein